MPYTPTAPTIILCDALVNYLVGVWKPKAPSGVARNHKGQTVNETTIEGRHVLIYPLGYASAPADRGHDLYEHRVGVLALERYTDTSDPDFVVPTEWIDERVDFVHTQIFKGFDFFRDGVQPSFNHNLQTLSNPVEVIYDPDRLKAKVFWSEIEFIFAELDI